jgi:hypothetical protein
MALDRFGVIKRDFTRNVCFRAGLASPSSGSQYAITLPAQWVIEELTAEPDATQCNGPGSAPNAAQATAGSGVIDWAGSMPCVVDFGISLTFAVGAPWIPANELLAATAVPVIGGPCGG